MARRSSRVRDVRRAPEPASLAGVEQEYRVLLEGQPVDFRWLIGRLPLDGSRLDPGDPLALRCAWGGVVTADDAEAEIAIPPVPVAEGWTKTAQSLLRAGYEELAGTLPPGFVLEGFSTHLSLAMPDAINDRVARMLARRFVPALMLLTGRRESPGVLVRPRPGRTELGIEHADGALLRAAAAFAAGAARVSAAAATGDRSARRMLPPSLRAHVVPAVRRYGFYVDRTAYGPDLLRDGREARLRRRVGGALTGQQTLEAAWQAARHGLVGADAADVDLLESMIVGRAPIPTEGPVSAGIEGSPPPPPSSPFGEALRVYRSASVHVRPLFVTWEFVVFEARCRGRIAYACVPRDDLSAFLGAMHRGRVDSLIEEFVAGDRSPLVLADHAQTGEPGLYDSVGEPGRLLPPERAPGGRGGPSVPGGRRSKQRGRRAERPRVPAPPIPVAPKRSRRGLVVAVVVAAVLVAGAGAVALTRGGSPAPVALPSTHSSPTPGATSSGQPNSSPPSTASPTPTTSPTPTQVQPDPPTALSGVYNVTVTVGHLGTKITGVHVGQSRHSSWLLSTDCSSRPCTLRLIGETRTGSKVDATGPFEGRTVKGTAEAGLQCQETSGKVVFVYDQTGGPFSVHVTKVQRVVGVPQATAFTGSFHFTWVPPAGKGVTGCPRTDETDTVTGVIHPAPEPAPLPPGAPTPPIEDSAVIGTWDTTLHVVAAKGIDGRSRGDDLQRLFSFIPNCDAGEGCALTLVRESGDGVARQVLKPGPGGSYSQVFSTTVDCGDGSATYDQTLTLKVEDAQIVGGVWRATEMSGGFEVTQKPKAGVTGCQPVHELDRISALAQG